MMIELQEYQTLWTQAIRKSTTCDPKLALEASRFTIYQRLVYNNIEGFLLKTFPVTHSLLDATTWQNLVSSFIRDFKLQSPYFLDIPRDFVNYLEQQTLPYPFLYELAHYEWVELAIETAKLDVKWHPVADERTLLRQVPQLSPLAWLLHYQYPVHQISHTFLPSTPRTTFLLIHRDTNYQTHFSKLDILSAKLIDLLSQDVKLTGQAALAKIQSELAQTEFDVTEQGLNQLNTWYQQQIILGGTS